MRPSAASGAQALVIDLASSAQTVITEWLLPDFDGLGLCRRLRAHGDFGFVYVIVVTAQPERDRVAEALNAGVNGYLAKPYNLDELFASSIATGRCEETPPEITPRMWA